MIRFDGISRKTLSTVSRTISHLWTELARIALKRTKTLKFAFAVHNNLVRMHELIIQNYWIQSQHCISAYSVWILVPRLSTCPTTCGKSMYVHVANRSDGTRSFYVYHYELHRFDLCTFFKFSNRSFTVLLGFNLGIFAQNTQPG